MTALRMKLPKALRTTGGVALPGTYDRRRFTIIVDMPLVTNRRAREMRPDLCIRLTERNEIFIFDVACTWEKSLRVSR